MVADDKSDEESDNNGNLEQCRFLAEGVCNRKDCPFAKGGSQEGKASLESKIWSSKRSLQL
jgi:hypothetical protein